MRSKADRHSEEAENTTSKFAVVGLSESLRNTLEPFKIGVSVLCPGPDNTNILSNSRDTQPPTQVTAEEAKVFETIITQVNAFLAAGVDPDEVGEMVLDALKANRDERFNFELKCQTRDCSSRVAYWQPSTYGAAEPTLLTGGGDQLPSRIEGGVSFGQYIRIIGMNCPAGAGSQFAESLG